MSIKMPISVRGVQFTIIRFTELYLEKSEFPNGKNASKSYFFFTAIHFTFPPSVRA